MSITVSLNYVKSLPQMNQYELEYPNWNNVYEFAKWYTENHMPVIIRGFPRIYVTENATSYIAFEQGRFQAEMYILHPNHKVDTPEHSHPGVDIITLGLNHYDLSEGWARFFTLESGDSHDAKFPPAGSVFLTCQHWKDNRKMTSAAVNWTGKLVGPLQEEMIREHYPTAIISDGRADTTQLGN